MTVALAADCNPGSSYTTNIPFCIAIAVREMRMTPDEAVWAATMGGARALRRDDVGHLGVGARADAVLLEAPSHVHLAYRPGVPAGRGGLGGRESRRMDEARVRPIVTVGDPVLRERARELAPEELRSPEVQRLIDDMIATMRDAGGAGLAANQVGELLRVAVVEVGENHPRYPYKPPIPLTVIVNPVIEPIGDETACRSTRAASRSPTCAATVDRHLTVRVRYLDRDGDAREEIRRGLTPGPSSTSSTTSTACCSSTGCATPPPSRPGAVRPPPPRGVRRARARDRRAHRLLTAEKLRRGPPTRPSRVATSASSSPTSVARAGCPAASLASARTAA